MHLEADYLSPSRAGGGVRHSSLCVYEVMTPIGGPGRALPSEDVARSPSDSLGWPVAAAVAAIGLLVVGVIVWRMWGAPMYCPPPPALRCLNTAPYHRLHPLRAEALWAASALSALIGLFWASRILIGRRRVGRPGGVGA